MKKPNQPERALPANLAGTWKLIDLPIISDHRGHLSVIEAERHVPFTIERVYYLYDVPTDLGRAGHAHKKLQQLIIGLSGSFQIHLDNGQKKETITLGKPWQGLALGPMVWREIDNFSYGCICLVLASLPYDETDYYRKYDDFRAAIK